jgi:hypothetical protein
MLTGLPLSCGTGGLHESKEKIDEEEYNRDLKIRCRFIAEFNDFYFPVDHGDFFLGTAHSG